MRNAQTTEKNNCCQEPSTLQRYLFLFNNYYVNNTPTTKTSITEARADVV